MSANDSIITVLADCWNSSILRPDLNTSASGVTAQTVENAIYAASFSFAIVLFGYIIFLVRVPRKRLIPFRVSAVAHYNKSAEGKVIEIFQAICSIGSCILFVAEGYEYPPVPDFYLIFELIFTSFFLVQYFLSLYMSENKVRYIFSFMALVDVVTIFPVYYLLGTGLANADSPGFGFLRFSRVVKFLRVLRLLRSMRVSKAAQGSQVETVIVGQFINIGAKVVSLLIITAGLVQFVAEMLNQCWDGNREYGQQFKFHDALYFTVVTLTTVGYGDIAPLTAVGRMLVIIVITVGLVWLPSELGKLSSLMKLKPPYSGSFKVNTEDRHVVVCSDENFNGVLDFLEEFYHPDHGFSTVKVCLMSPGLPTDELKNLLLEHQSDLRLSFIRGDPISTVDLGRARMEKAEACFLLTNKFHKNSDEQDSITVLRALAVKNYAPDMKTFVQIIEPENQKHIIAAGVQPHHIVCVDELKMGIIGLTCACPGFATLIANLISSSGDVPKSVQLDPWQQEYSSGLSQEIYHVDLAVFQGMTYKDALLSIYEKLGIMLFALEVKAKFGNVREVVIKPRMDYTIQKGDIGFVIAEDSEVTFIIDSAAPPEQREKYGMSDDKKKKKKGHKKGSQVLPDSPRKGGKGEDKGKDGEGEEKSSGTTGETIGVEGAVNGEGGSGEVEEVEGRGGTYEEGRRKLEPLNHVASISDTKQDKEGKEKMQEAGSKKEMDSARNGGGEVEIMEVNSVSATGGRIPSLNFSSLRKSGSEIKGKAGTKVASFASPVVTGKDVPSASKALAELQEYEDFFTSAEGGEVPQVFVGADSGHQVENIIETVYEKALRKDGKELLRRTLLVLLRDHYDFDLERITVDFVSLTHSLKMKEMEVIDAAAKEAAERANYSARAPISGRSLRSARTKERLSARGQNVRERDLEAEALRTTCASWSGHIIITCNDVDDMQYLIFPLRAPWLAKMKPIVIVCKELPTAEQWKEINFFDDLYVMRGEPSDIEVLEHAGIQGADLALILTPSKEGMDSTNVDAQVVLTVLSVEQISKVTQKRDGGGLVTIAELYHNYFSKHLGPSKSRRTLKQMAGLSYSYEPAFASGRVISASFLEGLLCQAYYNDNLIKVIRKLIAGVTDNDSEDSPNARGKGGPGKSGHPTLLPLPKQVRVMAEEERTFMELVKFFLSKHGILPIGLYRVNNPRLTGEDVGREEKMSKGFPYVFTAPSPTTTVKKDDKVYALVDDRLPAEIWEQITSD